VSKLYVLLFKFVVLPVLEAPIREADKTGIIYILVYSSVTEGRMDIYSSINQEIYGHMGGGFSIFLGYM
jgi:hypothetical protein